MSQVIRYFAHNSGRGQMQDKPPQGMAYQRNAQAPAAQKPAMSITRNQEPLPTLGAGKKVAAPRPQQQPQRYQPTAKTTGGPLDYLRTKTTGGPLDYLRTNIFKGLF